MKPDASQHNPDPAYLRQLVAEAGLTQNDAAATIGCSPRAFRSYLSTARDHVDAPYSVQFCLEVLAGTWAKRRP